MNVVETESIIFIDCDDTLVMWGKSGGVRVDLVAVKDPYYEGEEYLAPHPGHIKILKDRKARGSFIVVWSAGGFKWANEVVKALGLEKYVDLVMSKPHAYIDDKKAEDFMGERIYIPFGDGYGTKKKY